MTPKGAKDECANKPQIGYNREHTVIDNSLARCTPPPPFKTVL